MVEVRSVCTCFVVVRGVREYIYHLKRLSTYVLSLERVKSGFFWQTLWEWHITHSSLNTGKGHDGTGKSSPVVVTGKVKHEKHETMDFRSTPAHAGCALDAGKRG